jgi:hypothetical protein
VRQRLKSACMHILCTPMSGSRYLWYWTQGCTTAYPCPRTGIGVLREFAHPPERILIRTHLTMRVLRTGFMCLRILLRPLSPLEPERAR